jgi:hypothetical protein
MTRGKALSIPSMFSCEVAEEEQALQADGRCRQRARRHLRRGREDRSNERLFDLGACRKNRKLIFLSFLGAVFLP